MYPGWPLMTCRTYQLALLNIVYSEYAETGNILFWGPMYILYECSLGVKYSDNETTGEYTMLASDKEERASCSTGSAMM